MNISNAIYHTLNSPMIACETQYFNDCEFYNADYTVLQDRTLVELVFTDCHFENVTVAERGEIINGSSKNGLTTYNNCTFTNVNYTP